MGKALGHLPPLILCALLLALGAGVAIAAESTRTGQTSKHRDVMVHRCALRARAKRTRLHARCRRHGKTMLTHSGPTAKLPSAPGAPTSTTTPTSTLTSGTPPASSGSGGGEAEAPTPGEPPSIPHVQVTAVEYSFTLSRWTVPAGKVIFEFVNNGQDEHNLNIDGSEGELASTFANTPSKGVHDQTVEMHAGTYVMFCSLPEHESKGMKATLVVQ